MYKKIVLKLLKDDMNIRHIVRNYEILFSKVDITNTMLGILLPVCMGLNYVSLSVSPPSPGIIELDISNQLLSQVYNNIHR